MTRAASPAAHPNLPSAVVLALATALGTGIVGWWTGPLLAVFHGWRTGRQGWRGAALAVPAGWAGWLVVRSFFRPVAVMAGIASSAAGLPLVLFLLLVLAFGSAAGAIAAWLAGALGEAWGRRRAGAGGEAG